MRQPWFTESSFRFTIGKLGSWFSWQDGPLSTQSGEYGTEHIGEYEWAWRARPCTHPQNVSMCISDIALFWLRTYKCVTVFLDFCSIKSLILKAICSILCHLQQFDSPASTQQQPLVILGMHFRDIGRMILSELDTDSCIRPFKFESNV